MRKKIFSVLKYTVPLLLAVYLFNQLYAGHDMKTMWQRFSEVSYSWVFFSMFLSLLSHLSRAWRWTIMLRPLGYEPGPFKAYLAVMFGYLANLIFPRMGEVSRCAVLNRTSGVPVNLSFGAVIAERVIDLAILVSVTAFGALMEFDKIGDFLIKTFGADPEALQQKIKYLVIIALIGIAGIVALVLSKNLFKKLPFYPQIRQFLVGLKEGLLSLRKLNTQQKAAFWIHTFLIWALYYFTSYALFFCTEETSGLGHHAALAILVMTAISIAAPVQGGIGVYHLFIGATLLAYGIEDSFSKDFAFLMHSSQVFSIVLVGGISFIISIFLRQKKENPIQTETVNDSK